MTVVSEIQNEDATKNEILERGYWEIALRPVEYPKDTSSFERLRDILQTCQVRQRGWYYPHISDTTEFGGCHNANNYVESWVRYMSFAEIFRFYQSGQFVHYVGMPEDRRNDKAPLYIQWNPSMKGTVPDTPFLNPTSALYYSK